MKPTILNALIVDDHPVMVHIYEDILHKYNINTIKAYNCETAYKVITDTLHYKTLDLVVLDRSLPSFEAKNIHSGEDLAFLVRKHHPESKIALLTSHMESFIIYDIYNKIAPEGLIIKSDFDTEELLSIFNIILQGNTYHSTSVKESIKQILKNKIFLDADNREIASLVVKGIQNKNLHQHLAFSTRTINTRKAEIKDALGISNSSDEDLIKKIKKLGFV